MSGEAETLEQEENIVEGLLDQSVEAGADTEAEVPTEANETEAPEIDLSTLVDSRSDEEKQHNRVHAENRIAKRRAKELEDKVKELENQEATPDISDLQRPKRTDYLNSDVLYDKYNGDTNLAMAAFEDDREEYERSISSRKSEAQTQIVGQRERAQIHLDIENRFDEHAETIRGRVPNFDVLIDKAEEFLTYEGAIAIKDQFGDAAPLMLATIGSNKQFALDIASTPDLPSLMRKLVELEGKTRVAISSLNTQSTASSETAVKSTELSGVAAIDKAMQKAADEGDHKEYQRLKQQKKRVQSAK